MIKKYLDEPIPDWVDPSMYDKMNEKKHKNMYFQIAPIYEYLSYNKILYFVVGEK